MVNYFAIAILQVSLAFGNSSNFSDPLGFSSIDFPQNFVNTIELRRGGGHSRSKGAERGGKEHTKNARGSTKNKHEEGKARRARDQNRSNNPNKRK